jgi:hypothetical protein
MQRKERDPPSYDSFCSPMPLSMTEKKMEHYMHVLSCVCIIISDEEDFDFPSMTWIPSYVKVCITAWKYHNMLMMAFIFMIVCDLFAW